MNYPRYIVDEERPNHFLTSRIRITIDESVDLNEIIELAPIIRRLVPANVVVKVHAKELDKELGNSEFHVAIASKFYVVQDFSAGITDNAI